VGAAAFVLFVVANGFIAPGVIRTELHRAGPARLAEERGRLGEALRRSVLSAQGLSRRLDDLDRKMEGIRLGYRLSAMAVDVRPPSPEDEPRAGETMLDALLRQSTRLTADLQDRIVPLEARLSAAEAFELERPGVARFVPAASPLKGSLWVLTSRFGPRQDPFTRSVAFHPGVDLAAEKGVAVRSPADGVVSYAGTIANRSAPDWRRLGRVVAIRHGDAWLTLFGHLDSTIVSVGQRVSRGDLLGHVGESGWSAGPLLHYEVRALDRGIWRAVDPWPLLLDEDLVDEGIAPPVLPLARRLRAVDVPSFLAR
jgi:murein DD-endopeptidase MepM/ murein hydrolase activator NlpD